MECLLINKLKRLFNKIVDPNYVMDNYYADSLINKFSDSSDPDIMRMDSLPLTSDILIETFNLVFHQSHNTVKVFTIRMIAISARKELHFSKIIHKLGDKISLGFKDILSTNVNSSLKVAYMELALALVQHMSGIHWLFETGIWKVILGLAHQNTTVFVVRQTYQFASSIIWKLNEYGTDKASKVKLVLDEILKPIIENQIIHVDSYTSEQIEEISKAMNPSLQMLFSILSVPNIFERPNIVSAIILKNYDITHHLFVIFDRIRNNDITLMVTKCFFLIIVAKIFQQKPLAPTIVYSSEDFLDFSVWYFNHLHELIRRRNAILILDFCNAINMLWGSLFRNIKIENKADAKTIQLQNQLLFLCLMPPLVYAKGPDKTVIDKKINDNILKLVNMACEHSAKICYAFRDLVLEMEPVEMTLQSVKRLTCLKNNLNNEQANLVFQAMFYILKGFDPVDTDGEVTEDYNETEEKVLVITYVMDIVQSLVKNHDIKWLESLEILCLYTVVFHILKRPNLSCKFVVIALNVIALTVKKFLPPNLSLLMESKPGSATHELDKLIYMKMQDMHWEVRDSALELLLVCTEISYIKFPPFQKQIMDSKLINVAMTIALNDHEYYVQVSALKCVAAASKVCAIWEQLESEYPNVQDLLIKMLRNNQEGMVRKEVCNVLCEIYQNLKLTPAFHDTLYEHMVSAAIGDFHWEVQLSALKFWRVVIQSLLRDQGMLDGTFPPVTFSRETRKIVTLNDAELQRRLIKILDKLSEIGCITVLVNLLDEETEIEIMEVALSLSTELLEILTKYKVPDLIKPSKTDVNNIEELICHIKEEIEVKTEEEEEKEKNQQSDNVIEGILQADDINLLSSIYQRQLHIDNERSEDVTKPRVRLLKRASPYLFVTHVQSKDFKHIIEQKKLWKEGIRSLDSLLDDAIGEYEVNSYNEVNSLDCY